jgi:hypothetical protein
MKRNFFTKHLYDYGSGNTEETLWRTIKLYFKHLVLAMREFLFLAHACWAALIHALFPWWYGFEMIDWQIDMLKRLHKKLPDLEVWKRIDFKD